jgi:hypothetical protein
MSLIIEKRGPQLVQLVKGVPKTAVSDGGDILQTVRADSDIGGYKGVPCSGAAGQDCKILAVCQRNFPADYAFDSRQGRGIAMQGCDKALAVRLRALNLNRNALRGVFYKPESDSDFARRKTKGRKPTPCTILLLQAHNGPFYSAFFASIFSFI